MATSYPDGLDNFTNPTASDYLDSATVPHATQHANANDAIEAIEVELGTDPKGTKASVKARLDGVDANAITTSAPLTSSGTVGGSNLTVGINASSADTPNYVVRRDANGEFIAGAVTIDTSLTPTSAPGKLYWDGGGTVNLGLLGGNVSAALGENLFSYVTNAEATTLAIGEVVYVYGAQGNRISVKRASNSSESTSSKTLGIVAESIATNQSGFVITRGLIEKMTLGSYTEGAPVYLGSTAGTFTSTKPSAPNHLVSLGWVIRANNGNGQIYVNVQNGFELDELHDVSIVSKADGQFLIYDGPTSLWKNQAISATAPVTFNAATHTIAANAASTSASGVVQLSDSTSTTSSVLAATPTAVKAAYDAAVASVQTTRTISTTAPIAGGGDLSANRTLSLNIGSSLTTSASNLIVDSTIVPYLGTANTFTGGVQQITTASSSTVGLIVKGSASQSVSLQEWRDSSNNNVVELGTAQLLIQTNSNASARGFLIRQSNTGIQAATFAAQKSRGTNQSPTVVAIGDIIGAFTFSGYNGSSYPTDTALFGASVTGVSGSTISESLYFIAGTSASSNYNPSILIHHTGAVGIGPSFGSIIGTLTAPTGALQVNSIAVGTPVIIAKGAAAQTANLQEWQNSVPAIVAKVDASGNATFASIIKTGGTSAQYLMADGSVTTGGSGVSTSGGSTILASAIGVIPLVFKGASGQTANLTEWQNNAGTVLAQIDSSGKASFALTGSNYITNFGSGSGISSMISVYSVAGGIVPQTIRGTTAQTSDLYQNQSSAGTILSGFNAAGQIYVGTTASAIGTATTSIISAAYTSTSVAVFTYGGTSLVQVGQRVTIAGVSGGTYNGTWTVSAVTSTTFTVLGSGFTNVAGTGGTAKLSATGSFVAGTAAITPLVVQAATSQSASLQEWQDSSGNVIGLLSAGGRLSVRTGSVAASLNVNAASATNVGAIIFGAASQTADLQQWQSNAATLTAITSAGTINFASGNTSATATIGAITAPVMVAGYITMQVAGTTVKVPYYNN